MGEHLTNLNAMAAGAWVALIAGPDERFRMEAARQLAEFKAGLQAGDSPAAAVLVELAGLA